MSAEVARRLEAANWGWCVVWGAWHRSYTAWALWARDSLSVAAATPDELTALMRQAELMYGSPRPWR